MVTNTNKQTADFQSAKKGDVPKTSSDRDIKVISFNDLSGESCPSPMIEDILGDPLGASIIGLLGNHDGNPVNDIASESGTTFQSPVPFATMYGAYSASWRIRPFASLFDYKAGESTETFTIEDFPKELATSDQLDDSEYAAAEQMCLNAGVKSGIALEECILDVALTGEEYFAESAADILPADTMFSIEPPTFPPVGEEGLLAHFTFEGGAEDVSDRNRHGTVNGAQLTTDRFGNPNSAYLFDGFDDFIEVPVNINPEIRPELTLTAWVRSDGAGEPIQTVISHDDGNFDRGITIDFRGESDGWSAFSGDTSVLGGFPVEQGEWTFIAVIYDQVNGILLLFVDGETLSGSGTLGEGHNFLHIGSNPDFGEYFEGAIDEVRIYASAFTIAELSDLSDNQ